MVVKAFWGGCPVNIAGSLARQTSGVRGGNCLTTVRVLYILYVYIYILLIASLPSLRSIPHRIRREDAQTMAVFGYQSI